MFDDLLLHETVQLQLEQLIYRQPHAVLLSGPVGSGKETLLRSVAALLLSVDRAKLENHPNVFIADREESVISIENIRKLQQFLKLKVPGSPNSINRLVIIDNAERMRTEAQNALLKTLEEPPEDTTILLSTNHADQLLPTINSRVVEIAILPVSLQHATTYFKDAGVASAAIAKAYALSQGHAGLLYALLHNQAHALVEAVDIAKQLLGVPVSERLLLTDEYSKDKQQMNQLILALSRITHAALYQASLKNNKEAIKKWHQSERAVVAASDSLRHNPNTKLVLDNLFLNL